VLGYWKMRGIAQPIRFLLAYLKIDHEEKLFELGDAPDFSPSEWTNAMGSLELDFPKLPYFIDEEEGIRLTGHLSILKYLALKYGPESLLGSSLDAKAEIEMLASVLTELTKQATMPCYMSGIE